MNWIKENKFLAALCGGTLLGVILLVVVGYSGSSRYAAAQEAYESAAGDASGYEKGPLYPVQENLNAKNKALDDYRKSAEELQKAFAPYRPEAITNVSPQEFTNKLLAANAETRKAFEDNKVIVPEPYFVGFEKYKTTLASGTSTGILDYQLGGIQQIMLALAKAKPKELKNVVRPELPEESGKTYEPGDAVARPFPLEITFTGPEKSAREFVTALTKLDGRYAVVRVLRISNEKKDPPRSADAQFEKPAVKPAAGGGNDIFSSDFVLPGEEAAPAETPATPEEVVPEAAEVPAIGDSGRILSPVLGSEDVQVFLRIDLLEFLPAKPLR